jgi:hypothetical protein
MEVKNKNRANSYNSDEKKENYKVEGNGFEKDCA